MTATRPNLFLTLLLLLLLCADARAGHLHKEKWYQDRWCAEASGTAEVVMDNGTRCDCLTTSHAIEFDFAQKWAEAIGQSLNYSAMTGKTPGIVLILENPDEDRKYLDRLETTIKAHNLGIAVWTTGP